MSIKIKLTLNTTGNTVEQTVPTGTTINTIKSQQGMTGDTVARLRRAGVVSDAPGTTVLQDGDRVTLTPSKTPGQGANVITVAFLNNATGDKVNVNLPEGSKVSALLADQNIRTDGLTRVKYLDENDDVAVENDAAGDFVLVNLATVTWSPRKTTGQIS